MGELKEALRSELPEILYCFSGLSYTLLTTDCFKLAWMSAAII